MTCGSGSKPYPPSVHIKIAGKWMVIPLKMVLIGFDTLPCLLEYVWMVHLISWYILSMSTVFSVFSWDLCCAGLVLGWRDFSPSSASVISCFWVVSEVQACLKVQYLYIIEPKILDTRTHLLSLHSLLQNFPGIPTPHCFFNLVDKFGRGQEAIERSGKSAEGPSHKSSAKLRIGSDCLKWLFGCRMMSVCQSLVSMLSILPLESLDLWKNVDLLNSIDPRAQDPRSWNLSVSYTLYNY